MCDKLLLLPKDCVAEITNKIDTGSAWKSWISVSKLTNNISRRYPMKKFDLANKWLTLLKLFPNKPWVWYRYWLSANPAITWEFVQNNPDKLWDWTCKK